MKTSEKIFFSLIGIGIVCHIFFMPFYSDSFQDQTQMILNWISIPFYSILGYIGLKMFEEKAGFPDMLEKKITKKSRYYIPLVLGAIFALGAIIFDQLNPYKVPTLPLPYSIPYWIFVAIFDEFFWRLFFLTFMVWLISVKILKDNYQEHVFWAVSILEGVIYMLMQYGMFTQMVGPVTSILFAQIVLISAGYMVAACYSYRRGGFLAVMTVRLTQYMLYHVIYGSLMGI